MKIQLLEVKMKVMCGNFELNMLATFGFIKGGVAMIRIKWLMWITLGLVFSGPLSVYAVGLGDKAPLFTAASDKGEVSLNDYLGQKYVIISFYFAINTPA